MLFNILYKVVSGSLDSQRAVDQINQLAKEVSREESRERISEIAHNILCDAKDHPVTPSDFSQRVDRLAIYSAIKSCLEVFREKMEPIEFSSLEERLNIFTARDILPPPQILSDNNVTWRPIAEQLGYPIKDGYIMLQVQQRIGLLHHQIEKLPLEQVPLDVKAQLSEPPTIASTRFLQLWQRARDTLVVWDKLARATGQTTPTIIWDDGYQMIIQAAEFQKWMKTHQTTLETLRQLDLTASGLATLPPEIRKLRALNVLFLANNRLTAVLPEIGELTALIELSFAGNKITALPPEIGKLTQLTRLDFAKNKLRALPPEIGNLTALKQLLLEDNKITFLPSEIGKLTALTCLHLKNNPLIAFPSAIWNLTALIENFNPHQGLNLTARETADN